jgi:uncharacterized protein
MPLLSRMMLAKLPVKDLAAAIRFFDALGFEFMGSMTTDAYALIVVNDGAGVLLMTEEKFSEFTPHPVSDARQASETLIVVPAQTREEADAFAEAARSAGAPFVGDPSGGDKRYGVRIADLDGHLWEMVCEHAELAAVNARSREHAVPDAAQWTR